MSEYRCATCGDCMMNVQTGSVCPNGHGKIQARIPKKQARRNHAILQGLRDARWSAVDNAYVLPDDSSLYRVKKRLSVDLGISSLRLDEGEVLALDGCTVLVLSPKD